jgi:RNA 3'-terminal phosphate cyclase (ATP)
VGEHLADQLLVPMALAGAGAFVSLPPTQHALTNAEVIRKFLDVRIEITHERGEAHRFELQS